MSSEERYEAQVPDTLDLAERARLSVNSLTGSCDPAFNYETVHNGHLDYNPAFLNMWTGGPCHPKVLHVLPLMRLMSGSTQHIDYDEKMLDFALDNVDEKGVWWLPRKGAPWRANYGEHDVTWLGTAPRIISALMDRYVVEGDNRWLEFAGRMVHGMAKLTAEWEEVKWIPGYYLSREAKDTAATAGEDSATRMPVPDHGWVSFWSNGKNLLVFSRYYALTGDVAALDVADGIANFMMMPEKWNTGEGPTMVAQAEHGLWRGHFHGYTRGMMGMAEYAIATKNTRMQEFVARAYEYARNLGISRMGFFPGVVNTKQAIVDGLRKSASYRGRPAQNDEACGLGNMTWLAVRLSEAGIGDYWDDADQYVRNHLTEHQMLDRERMAAVVAASPVREIDPAYEITEDAVERQVGAFASISDPTWAYAWWTMCCNTNAPEGMYVAWEGIVRSTGDVAQVNLLLNRASPWLDLDSYLPYEGKVVLRNKTARKVNVRLSKWIDKAAVRARVNEREIPLEWLGNYLVIEGVAPCDVVTIEFPVAETTEPWTEETYETTYTCEFRGNTLVDISPRFDRPAHTMVGSDDGLANVVATGYPLYLRDHMKAKAAPMTQVQRYVAPRLV